MQGISRRSVLAAALLLAGVAVALPARPHGVAGAIAWLVLCGVPGAALAVFIDRRLALLETILAGLLFSPLVNAALASLMMFAGREPESIARVLVITASAAGAAALFVAQPATAGMSRRQILALTLLIAGFAIVTGLLPQTAEWWRMRSDAWFHAAVVAEIRDFGLPPTDPYFAGVPLQYMWAYHVLVLHLATASGLDGFRAMALVNTQALCAFLIATFLFARTLGADFRRAFASAAFTPLGLSALFWAFLPIRLARALLGRTRGGAELAREFDLTPFTYDQVRHFTTVWHNPEFFLDKFMVATAFSVGLALFAACWFGAADYVRTRRPFGLVTVFFSVAGMLAFHTPIGLVMLVVLCGASVLVVLAQNRLEPHSPRAVLAVSGAALAALVVTAPYLYTILHAKDTGAVAPAGIALNKIASVFIATSLAGWLFLCQRGFLRRRDAQGAFVLCAAAVTVVFSLLLRLPASNVYDKPGYFIYYPLAVVGAWTIADRLRTHRRAIVWTIAVLVIAPVNVLSLAACYFMQAPLPASRRDAALSRWVGAHTERDDVFVDRDSRVTLLVTGPRRYYYGRESYAGQWGYDRAEMARRRGVVQDLLGDDNVVSPETLQALDAIDAAVYIVVRDSPGGPPAPAPGAHPDRFALVFDADDISLYIYRRSAGRP